uniref:Uncharacterized protein n=1 Tax=Anopheles merus TaxID=30066 RepID=A0A182V2J7_ANOME
MIEFNDFIGNWLGTRLCEYSTPGTTTSAGGSGFGTIGGMRDCRTALTRGSDLGGPQHRARLGLDRERAEGRLGPLARPCPPGQRDRQQRQRLDGFGREGPPGAGRGAAGGPLLLQQQPGVQIVGLVLAAQRVLQLDRVLVLVGAVVPIEVVVGAAAAPVGAVAGGAAVRAVARIGRVGVEGGEAGRVARAQLLLGRHRQLLQCVVREPSVGGVVRCADGEGVPGRRRHHRLVEGGGGGGRRCGRWRGEMAPAERKVRPHPGQVGLDLRQRLAARVRHVPEGGDGRDHPQHDRGNVVGGNDALVVAGGHRVAAAGRLLHSEQRVAHGDAVVLEQRDRQQLQRRAEGQRRLVAVQRRQLEDADGGQGQGGAEKGEEQQHRDAVLELDQIGAVERDREHERHHVQDGRADERRLGGEPEREQGGEQGAPDQQPEGQVADVLPLQHRPAGGDAGHQQHPVEGEQPDQLGADRVHRPERPVAAARLAGLLPPADDALGRPAGAGGGHALAEGRRRPPELGVRGERAPVRVEQPAAVVGHRRVVVERAPSTIDSRCSSSTSPISTSCSVLAASSAIATFWCSRSSPAAPTEASSAIVAVVATPASNQTVHRHMSRARWRARARMCR